MTDAKFLLKATLHRHDLAAEIYHIKEPQKVPLVLNPDEIKRLLIMARSVKIRTVLSLSYGCALEPAKVTRLKAGDIDSAQSIIRVVLARGGRRIMLPPVILDLLHRWWPERPTQYDAGIEPEHRYLFPGRGRR